MLGFTSSLSTHPSNRSLWRRLSWRQSKYGLRSCSGSISASHSNGDGATICNSYTGDIVRGAREAKTTIRSCNVCQPERRCSFSHSKLCWSSKSKALCNLRPNCVVLISRNCHSRQNTNDCHNDHQFDQSKTLLNLLHLNLLHDINLNSCHFSFLSSGAVELCPVSASSVDLLKQASCQLQEYFKINN